MADPGPRIGPTTTFLTLPIELRLQIYSSVFADRIIGLPFPHHHRNDWNSIQEQSHQLLFVCRQTYLEAQRLFYGTVTWSFSHHVKLNSFFGPCEQRQLRMHWIKHIRLPSVQMLTFLPLAKFTALNQVEIQVDGDAYFNYAEGAMFDVHLSAGELFALTRETIKETLATCGCERDVYESLQGRKGMRVLFLVDHTFCGKAGLRRTRCRLDPAEPSHHAQSPRGMKDLDIEEGGRMEILWES